MLLKKALFKKKLKKLRAGYQATLRLTLLNMRASLRLLKTPSTQSCKRYMLKVEFPLEPEVQDSPEVLVSQEVLDSQEVLVSLEELDSLEPLDKEDHQAQALTKLIDREYVYRSIFNY